MFISLFKNGDFMKRFITFFGLIVLFATIGSFAKDYRNLLQLGQQDFAPPPVKTITLESASIFDNSKPTNDDPLITYRTIAGVINGQFTLFNNITPIVYEPATKSIILALANYMGDGQGNIRGMINLYISTNDGSTWQPKQVFNTLNDVPVLSSLGVWNPNNSTDVNSLSFFVYSPFARRDLSGQFPWAGGLYTIYTNGQSENVDFLYPGNASGYSWWASKVVAHTTEDGSYAYNVGTLRNSPSTQYGAYGFASFSLGDFDFLYQGIPPQWAVSKFRPAPELTSTYNSGMLIDVDNNGTVYAAVANYFLPNVDANARVPGISKSTDYGQTWSEFEPMPLSVLADYVQSYGGVATQEYALISAPYHPNAFIVTGPDEYSFFTRVLIWQDQNHILGAHIVEMQKQYGMWSVRKIADFNGFPMIIQDVSPDQNTLKDSLYVSFMGQELQAAKTADGNHLIVKWVDYINQPIVINPPLVIGGGAQTLDTLLTNDVFFSYRETSNYNWNPPMNVTNDTVYNKITWIPKLVPSIGKIPLVQERTQRIQYTDLTNPRNNYPNFVQQLVVDYPQDVVFSLVSLTTSQVEQEPTATFSFELKDVVPNPVPDYVDIRFVLNQAMHVKLEIFDALGNKLENLFEGFAPEGHHAVVFNTLRLANGVYYCKLTADSKTQTKLLNVMH